MKGPAASRTASLNASGACRSETALRAPDRRARCRAALDVASTVLAEQGTPAPPALAAPRTSPPSDSVESGSSDEHGQRRVAPVDATRACPPGLIVESGRCWAHPASRWSQGLRARRAQCWPTAASATRAATRRLVAPHSSIRRPHVPSIQRPYARTEDEDDRVVRSGRATRRDALPAQTR